MIKEAIDRVLNLDRTIVTEDIDGRKYSRHQLEPILKDNEYSPAQMNFNTLTGLVEFAREFHPPITADEGVFFFHVDSPVSVNLCGTIQPYNHNRRWIYARSEVNMDSFRFAHGQERHWHDLELFVISLQSLFVQTETREQIIDMLGCVANEIIQENKDDGFTQTLQVRTGITHREQVTVKNPVKLQPYRTFREIEQPEGDFILRFNNERGIRCALWEADGGIWKLEAMKRIVNYLNEQLPEIKAIA